MTLLSQLTAIFSAAFEAAGAERRFGEVLPSQRPDLCQFQCNGAMAAAKAARQNPRALAEAVLSKIDKSRFKDLSLAGPGFINITLSDAWLCEALAAAAADPRLGVPKASPARKILLDFGGPNVAKPMHVGHLRSAIIGDSLQRLHRFLGHDVTSDVHLGDWGTQMGMLIEEVRLKDPNLPYFNEDFSGEFPEESPVTLEDLETMYPRAAARCKADPIAAERARKATQELQAGRNGYHALWSHFVKVSKAALQRDFGALGISFDLWLGESNSQPSIPPMLEDLKARGISQVSEGATVIMLDPEKGGAEIPPLLLVKSDGGYLYGTTDLATLKERVDRGYESLLYVADKRQSLHFRQVFSGAKKSGLLGSATAEHIAFGTVNGKDGKPFKTREGGVMKLHDMLNLAVAEAEKRMRENEIAAELNLEERAEVARRVGHAAVKYADLSNHRTSDYIFDLEKFMQFEGRTGPYLLYAAVRIKSILKKAGDRNQEPGALREPESFERPLYLKITALPEILERAADESLPHIICEYAYELAGEFSTFYQGCNIINETETSKRSSWLSLSKVTLRALERTLGILGLEVPEKM